MPINTDIFDEAVIKALSSDVEIVLPSYMESLKLLLGNVEKEWSIDRAYNELFYLNLYTYCMVINNRFKDYGPELTNRLNILVESFLKNELCEELVYKRMFELNLRFLEYSKRVDEFVQSGKDHKSQMQFTRFLTSKILGDNFKTNLPINMQIFTFFGASLKTIGKYFDGLEYLIIEKEK